MESGEGSAGRLIRDPELYNNLNGAAKDLRKLIADIRKDPAEVLAGQGEPVLMLDTDVQGHRSGSWH